MHRALALALGFPDYYGNNLDALDECLGGVAEHEYGWEGDETGLVLVFASMKPFRKRHKRAAETLLEIVTERCSYAALFGNRLLALVSETPLPSNVLERPV
jgi:RNAse (barnase) inhibitor barstar